MTQPKHNVDGWGRELGRPPSRAALGLSKRLSRYVVGFRNSRGLIWTKMFRTRDDARRERRMYTTTGSGVSVTEVQKVFVDLPEGW